MVSRTVPRARPNPARRYGTPLPLVRGWAMICMPGSSTRRAVGGYGKVGSCPGMTRMAVRPQPDGCRAIVLSLPAWLLAEHQDVLVDDVRDECARVAIRPEPRAGLVPDDVALDGESHLRRQCGDIRRRKEIATVLVGITNDEV